MPVRALLTLFSLLLAAPAAAEPVRVAVLELVHADGLRDREAAWLVDVLRQVAVDNLGPEHQVLTRNQLTRLLPQGVDPGECADDCDVLLGQRLGADGVVAGEVIRLGERLKLVLRLHAVADGALVAVEHGESATVAGLEPAMRVAGLRITGAWLRHRGAGAQPVEAPQVAVGPAEGGGTLFIDAHEVTVAAWRRCVAAGVCAGDESDDPLCNGRQPGRDDHPMNCVTWPQAQAFCQWRGRRLPSVAEWRRAAQRPPDPYPWGQLEPTCERAVVHAGAAGCGQGGTAPVGSRPQGASVHGAHDLVGNVREWVRPDEQGEGWRPAPWDRAPLLGGAWHHGADLRALTRGVTRLVGAADPFSGLRCAQVVGP